MRMIMSWLCAPSSCRDQGPISDNREAMDKVVEILCEKETMSGDEFRAILAEYTVIPEENLEAARATVTIN